MNLSTWCLVRVVAAAGLAASTLGCGTLAATHACSNEDVEATLGQWEGATGSAFGFVVLANRTDRPCELAGSPELRLIDAEGRLIAREPERPPVEGAPRVLLAPGSGPPEPDGARAGQASFSFLFGNVCDPLPDGQGRVEARLPGEIAALVFAAEIPSPRCDSPLGSVGLGVQSFVSPAPIDQP